MYKRQVGDCYPVEEIIEHEIIPWEASENKISGMIDAIDYHFGLICSNIPADVFEEKGISFGDTLHVVIRDRKQEKPVFVGQVPYVPSFGSVAEGEALLMTSETLQIQIAINCVNMAEQYSIHEGADWTIEIEREV